MAALGEFQHLPRAQRTHIQSFDWMFQVVTRAGGRRQVPDIVHRIKLNGARHIMQKEVESGVCFQMTNIPFAAREQVVQAKHLKALSQ